MNRRGFLARTVAGTAASLGSAAAPLPKFIDTHVYLSRWPFRRMPGEEAPDLVVKLREQGVTEAWVASFDGVFHKDLWAANQRLAGECERHKGLLRPFGAVNPRLPDWEEDLRRCRERLKMPGIRLYPGYHNYTLADEVFQKLFQEAARLGLLIELVVWMEDERHQNPLMQIPAVDLKPLPGLMRQVPEARVVVLNGFAHDDGEAFRRTQNVAFDIARLDGYAEVRRFVDRVGIERVVFGSYMPMFYFASATLKLREAELTRQEQDAIQAGNAGRLSRG